MKIFSWVPNFLTLCNLFCGSIGVIFALEGNFEVTFWMCIASAMCDFFDGFAARLLNAYSPMGKELDSLADLVSFGFVPSAVLFSILSLDGFGIWSYVAFLVVAFSALRLAKFNIDDRQTTGFIGLPTPACALFFVSYALVAPNLCFIAPWVSLVLAIIFALLLVSPFKMFALKFGGGNKKATIAKIIAIVVMVIAFAIYREIAVCVMILLYVLGNLIRAVFAKKEQL